jgi:4-hydroxybenzoyl-CoA thioesterase
LAFSLEIPVRFGDVDHARVVYYPRFFHYFHQAFEGWFGEALGIPYSDVVGKHNIGFPSVHIETDFLKPLRYGDSVRVEVDLVSTTSRSLTMRYTAVRLPDGQVSARALIKTVAVDNDEFKSIEIPEAWRKRLRQLVSARAGTEARGS